MLITADEREKRKAKRFVRSLLAIPPYEKKLLDTQYCAELICKGMDAKEYRKLKDEAEARYLKELEAIETVWRISNRNEPPPELPSTADMIRRVLPSFGERGFTVAEMKEAIERMYPQMKGRIRITTLSGTFTRMAKRGDSIRVIRKGSGTTPATYNCIPEGAS
jgi:hypothetical protein